MAKISLEITTSDQEGKNRVMNISYINPEVENDKLLEFAVQLVSLTTHTYQSLVKVTKETVI